MVEFTEQDKRFMQEAVDMAIKNVPTGHGGPFGAVIVKDGEVIAKAANSVIGDNDPTAHAEVNAIRLACKRLGTYDLSGCVIYASCEPCPMCLSAIYWAKLDKIYYAGTRFDANKAGFADEFIYDEFAKTVNNRRLPIIKIYGTNVDESFEAWRNKQDKKEY